MFELSRVDNSLPPWLVLQLAAGCAIFFTIIELNHISRQYLLGLSWRTALMGEYPKLSDAIGRWQLVTVFIVNLSMNVLLFVVLPLAPYYLIELIIDLAGYRLLSGWQGAEFVGLVYLIARSAKLELDRRLASRSPTQEEEKGYQAFLGGYFREWYAAPRQTVLPQLDPDPGSTRVQGLARTIETGWRAIETTVARPMLRLWAALYDAVFSELILSAFRKAQPYVLTAGAETLLEQATTRRVLTALGSSEVNLRMNGQVATLSNHSAVYIAEAMLIAYKGYEDTKRFVLSYRRGQPELRKSLRMPVDCSASLRVAKNGCSDHPMVPQCIHMLTIALLDESPFGLGLKLDGDGHRRVLVGAAAVHLERQGRFYEGRIVTRHLGANGGMEFEEPIPEPCLAAHHPTWTLDGSLDWTRSLA